MGLFVFAVLLERSQLVRETRDPIRNLNAPFIRRFQLQLRRSGCDIGSAGLGSVIGRLQIVETDRNRMRIVDTLRTPCLPRYSHMATDAYVTWRRTPP